MDSVFVFAYYSYKDPVFQSALLPYLKMVSSSRLRLIILTWEQDQYAMDAEEVKEVKQLLHESNIIWYTTRWHSGRFKLLKKGFDLLKGIVYSAFFISKFNAVKIYSEGFPGAVIGHYLSIVTGVHHIIHTFEPHAEYMVESGVWTRKHWEYRLLKKLEISIARRAQYIVTGTQAYKEILSKDIDGSKIVVIPSCVDTAHYKFLPTKRDDLRRSLGLKDDQIVVVYLGKMGGMYMDYEIFQFFKLCLGLKESKFFFFLFTNEDIERVTANLEKYEIPLSKVLVKYLDRKEVPEYLSAADIGFCGIKPIPSRRYSSPIKNGEYWACGLPVLVPEGISDDYIHCMEQRIGYSFRHICEINLQILESLKAKDRYAIQTQCYSIRALETHSKTFNNLFETPPTK